MSEPSQALSEPVLVVEGLRTHFFTKAGVVKAVDDVSFTVARGEVLGLVGESGSGKSMTGYSLMGLIDPPGRIVGGSIVSTESTCGHWMRKQRHMRGNRVAMIFPGPDDDAQPGPAHRRGDDEAILAHRNVARRRAACAQGWPVGIPRRTKRLAAYRHQFSGGMRQRVAIAIALLNSPDLIIADEPTTALDVTIQGQTGEMQKLARDSGTAPIWITHDLSVVAAAACVMYAGRIVENRACKCWDNRCTRTRRAARLQQHRTGTSACKFPA
jgi:peptide/nickel transport system ATP-binding protein